MSRRLTLDPRPSGLPATPWRLNLPANITQSGRRERRFFRTRVEAETYARQQRIRLENFGRNSIMLSPGQQEEAATAFNRLAPLGVSLNTVVADYLSRHEAAAKSVTFKELFDRFMEAKEHRSDAYRRGLKYTFPRFPSLHAKKVSAITPLIIEAELEGMSPAARNAFVRNLRAIFNYGVDRGWLKENPVAKLDLVEIKRAEVVTLTPTQAASLMNAAANANELLPYHALGLFAGIRPMELERLDWQHIDTRENHIEITAKVSKTSRRRIVEMEANLAAWITHYKENGGQTEGKVTPLTNLRKRLREIREAAGLKEWVQDVMRHSYASYWLAHHESIDRLTLNMGHESTTMLWKHYHKASKKQEATQYWSIIPAPLPAANVSPQAC